MGAHVVLGVLFDARLQVGMAGHLQTLQKLEEKSLDAKTEDIRRGSPRRSRSLQ